MPEDPSTNFRIFTMALILTGVGTALYTATVLLESVVEGRLSDRIGRRRMQRTIDDLERPRDPVRLGPGGPHHRAAT